MAITVDTVMKELVVVFEEGHSYKFKGLNLDPAINKSRDDVKDHLGGFDFEDEVTHEVITIYPNQFHAQISIVERDGDCVKLVRRRSKYAGGFVEFFKKNRAETSKYGELESRLHGHTFICRQRWEHSEALKGFNPTTRKMSNLWTDANLSGFMSFWLGYASEDPQIIKDPAL